MSKSYISDGISRRNKTFFKSNKQMNRYIYDDSIYYGSGTGDKITTLIYYIEFDRTQTTTESTNFNSQHDAKLTALKIDTDYISASGTTYITTSISDGDQYTKILLDISNSLSTSSNFYTISQYYLEELKKQIVANNFKFTFADENGNNVVANTVTALNSDGYHNDFYRYNTLYTFSFNSNIQIKFENAHLTATSNFIKHGDKVWILNSSDQYLSGDFNAAKSGFNSGAIIFETGTNDRLLFEINAFNDAAMTSAISSSLNIQFDYGFKIEILPMTIRNLFGGLTSFVDTYDFNDAYTFTDDGDYIIQDGNASVIALWDDRGATFFYNIETGVSSYADYGINFLEENVDSTYNIDEVWLTWDTTYNFGFTYDNNKAQSKRFFNGSEV
jgi:hypothetical protein